MLSIPKSLRAKLTRTHRLITLTPLTTSFFVFTFVSCFAQALIHSFLFTIDNNYNGVLTGIVRASGISPKTKTFTDLLGQESMDYWSPAGKGQSPLKLIKCTDVMPDPNASFCSTVFDTRFDHRPATSPKDNAKLRGALIVNSLGNITFQLVSSTPNEERKPDDISVLLTTRRNETIALSQQCTNILTYPQQHLHNALREDLALMLIQFWLFGMGVYAMVFDSVAHVIAPLLGRTLMLAWSAYAVFRTHHQGLVYEHLVERPGSPCSLALFSSVEMTGVSNRGYFTTRMAYEIPDLVLNVATWIVAVYLSWTLLSLYRTQSSKCIGAPKPVFKVYKYYLALLSTIHLSLFVIPMTLGLWIDQLFNSYIRHISLHTPAYVVGFVIICVLIIPHLLVGHRGLRNESRQLMLTFIGINFVFLVLSTVIFYSQVFRWTFLAWPHVGCYTVSTIILTLASLLLSVWVYKKGFGKGVKSWLHAESVLSSQNFAEEVFVHDAEKAVSNDETYDDGRSDTSSIRKMRILSADLSNPYTSSPKKGRGLSLSIQTGGIPLMSPGVVISPTVKTTAQLQQEQGITPAPTYSLAYDDGPGRLERHGSIESTSSLSLAPLQPVRMRDAWF